MSGSLTIRISVVAWVVKNMPAMKETWVRSLGWEDSPGEGDDHPLQYPWLENSMDRGAWLATIRGDTKSWTRLSKTFASTVKQKATIEVFKPLLISKFCVDSNYTYYFHIYADVIIDEVFTNFILSMHSSGDNYWKFYNHTGWCIVCEQLWSW